MIEVMMYVLVVQIVLFYPRVVQISVLLEILPIVHIKESNFTFYFWVLKWADFKHYEALS